MQVLRLPEACAKTGLNRTSLYADPTFPKPIKLGPRARGWVEAEIDEWIESKRRERDADIADEAA